MMLSKAHRQLVFELARRELSERYAGSTFGMAWSFIHPLTMMTVYLMVFGYIINLRMPERAGHVGNYTLYFLAGYICWAAVMDILGKAAGIILTHASLVKQVVFPVEILPIKSALASFFTLVVMVIGLYCYIVALGGGFRAIHLMIFPLLALQFLFMCGVAYMLAIFGLFFRDTRDFVQIFLTVGLFISPVIFTPDTLSGRLGLLIMANPFSYPIFCFQDVFYFGEIAHPQAWIVFVVMTATLLGCGRLAFVKLQHTFGDAI